MSPRTTPDVANGIKPAKSLEMPCAMRYNQAMEEYGTLADATTDAGYCSKSTLKTAALLGTIKTIKTAPTFRMTTRTWVDE